MKLLLDQHLSPRLCSRLGSAYPGSMHVQDLGLGSSDDREIWNQARERGFMIVTKDADFADLVAAWGYPPKVLWLRMGNCTTESIENLLRSEREMLEAANENSEVGVISLG